MGWTSSGDALTHQFNSTVNFESKEAAVAFCEKHGWEYEVMEPQKMGRGASTIPRRGQGGDSAQVVRRQLRRREEGHPRLAPSRNRRG